MSARFLTALLISTSLHASSIYVEFPYSRIPKHLWQRELVWLKNIGLTAVDVAAEPAGAKRISVLNPDALIESRRTPGDVVWTDVESQVTPVFHAGAASLSGEETPALQVLRREALIHNYWGALLEAQDGTVAAPMPDTITVKQRAIPEASIISVINTGKKDWTGEIHAALPSFKKVIRIPDVTVGARDGLMLPVDVAFSDKRFCHSCSGMSNSERLLYATEELTAMEYENGILSFEFYAPHAGVAVLQLEREPGGLMLAAGHPMEFDWDADNKRAKLPIPAGKGPGQRVRIAVTMTAPDHVASFVNAHTLIIGETNHILTDYSSEEFAKRSRMIGPPGWKLTAVVRSPTQTEYAVEVPKDRLHGEHEELRLEADGVGMSHVRMQLLRPVSIHVAEATAIHFGKTAEMLVDPPIIPVEGPNGRDFTIQLRNNAPEIRNFQVAVSGDQLEFSPQKVDVSIGASVEREVPIRVFVKSATAGLHEAKIRISGAAQAEQTIRFLVLPRGESVNYQADLLDTGGMQNVWENDRIRAVMTGDRWIEFYWKESGRSFLPPEGVPLSGHAMVELHGSELSIAGASDLPKGGTIENVTWKAEVEGTTTRYRITETKTK